MLVEEIKNNLYVDNLLPTANSLEEARYKYKQVKQMFGDLSMYLREFVFNDSALLSNIATADKSKDRNPKSLWKAIYTWDEKLPETRVNGWKDIVKPIHGFHKDIARIIFKRADQQVFVAFADASLKGEKGEVRKQVDSEEERVASLKNETQRAARSHKVVRGEDPLDNVFITGEVCYTVIQTRNRHDVCSRKYTIDSRQLARDR
uniref:DHC_N1 domain-containing protein n=1 Tax=Haemonchus contortus TaxID=6289 RepID=A0A7I4Z2J1_HAECO